MNPRRIRLIALEGLRDALHLRLVWLLVAACLGLAAGSAALAGFNFGLEEPRFLADVAAAVLELFGTLQAVLLTVALVQGGIERGRPQLLFARGVRRAEWLLGNLIAAAAASAALVLAMQAVLGGCLAARGHAVSLAALADTGGRTLLRLELVAGYALVTAVVCRQGLPATLLALALAVASHLVPFAQRAAEHSGAAAHPVWVVLARLVPDFSAIAGDTALTHAAMYAGGHGLLQVLAAGVILSGRDL